MKLLTGAASTSILSDDARPTPRPVARRVLVLLTVAAALTGSCAGATAIGDSSVNAPTSAIGPNASQDTGDIRDFTVSLVELISRPRDFEGRRVSVMGTLAVGFEHNAIYLHREDFDHSNTANAVWVNVPADYPSRSTYHERYVTIVGTFSAKGHGHLGMFVGELTPEWINKQ